MDNIIYNIIDVEIPDFDPEFFDLWLRDVIKLYKVNLKELSYIFCSDEYLLEMNKEYLGHDYYTDVITFNYNEGNSLSGDVFISYERIIENAKEFTNKNDKKELGRVMVHGLLHLIGYNDKSESEKEVMRGEEDKCLKLKSFT